MDERVIGNLHPRHTHTGHDDSTLDMNAAGNIKRCTSEMVATQLTSQGADVDVATLPHYMQMTPPKQASILAKKFILTDPLMYTPAPPDKSLSTSETEINFDTEFTGILSPTQRFKAMKILKFIRDNPCADWSDDGELIYRRSGIPNSNVVDIFADDLTTKRLINEPGSRKRLKDIFNARNTHQALAKRRSIEQKWTKF